MALSGSSHPSRCGVIWEAGLSSYHYQVPNKSGSEPQPSQAPTVPPTVLPGPPGLHLKGPTKLGLGYSSAAQVGPDPAKQVFLVVYKSSHTRWLYI